MSVEQYSLVANDWLNLEFIINDLTQRVIGQELSPGSSPTWVGATFTGKIDIGSQASPVDVTSTRQHGFELHYSGNDYDVTGIRSRAQLVTTDTTATAQGALLQAANNDGIDVGVLQGALIEAIGKSTTTAATIAVMRGALINTEWDDYDTVTNLKTLHIRTHSRNAAGAGSFGTGYGIYIENEGVGGNGQAYDAGIYFKGTNLSAGNKAFTYGIDFSGGTYGTAEMLIGNAMLASSSNSLIIQPVTDSTTFLQIKNAAGAIVSSFNTKDKKVGIGRATGTYTVVASGGAGPCYMQLSNNNSGLGGSEGFQYGLEADGVSTYVINRENGFMRFRTNNLNRVSITAGGNVGLGGETAPETLLELTHATPYITLHNPTHEDTDGGGESRLIFKREDGAGTETACFQFEASHDGAVANDQLGKGVWSVNTGSGLVEGMRLDTGGLTLTNTSLTVAGESFLRVTGLQADGISLTGTLRGVYIDVSNGETTAIGTIRGMELKARTAEPGELGGNVNVLEGLSISADSKGHSVTTMRAAEFILDGSAGGTITEAVGLRIANNLQANKATTSYGLQIYRDSFDYTADIQLSNGATIGISTSNASLKFNPSGWVGIYLPDGVDADDTLSLGSTVGAEQMGFIHTGTHAQFRTTTGEFRFQTREENGTTYLAVRGNGTPGNAHLYLYDEVGDEYLDSYCSAGIGYIRTAGSSPSVLNLQDSAHASVLLFSNAAEGETQQLYIYGRRTGDSKRSLEISVGVDAADTASFDGVSNYRFDGRIELTQQSGSTNDGALWNDSTQEALQTFTSGIEQTLVGVIFTQTADQTIANTTTETTLFGTGVGTLTLPANFWVVGKTIRVEIHGDFADTGNPTAEVQAYYGATSLIDSGAITLSGLGGTEEWETEVIITCRSTGVTGTVQTIIDWEYETTTGSSAIERLDVEGVLRTIDTTASGVLDVTFQWGTAVAANTLHSHVGFVEVLN